MLKTLYKKQVLEMTQFIYRDTKKGANRSKGGVAGMVVLWIIIALFAMFAFFGIGDAFASTMLPLELNWLYFTMMGTCSVLVGTFGGVFFSYSQLFRAKDNAFLLTLPIPPRKLFFVRMSCVFVICLFFCFVGWLPAILQYCIKCSTFGLPVGTGNIVSWILLWIFIACLATAFACFLGWIVALISGKIQHKSIVATILIFVCLGLYYVVYFRMQAILTQIITNTDSISQAFQGWGWPLYQLGLGATGNALSLLCFALIALVLFGIVLLILSKTFIHMATSSAPTAKSKDFTSASIKTNKVSRALFQREFKRFTSSTVYLANCGLGLLFFVVVLILLLIKINSLTTLIEPLKLMAPHIYDMMPIFLVMILGLLASTCAISAPSVSLEGKNLWILKTLPVETKAILDAKLKLHGTLVGIPAAICAAVGGCALKVDGLTIILMVIFIWFFVWFLASLGLRMDLRKPNFNWSHETVPVKQSMPVAVCLLGGWIICIVLAALCYFATDILSVNAVLGDIAVIMLFAYIITRNWLFTKGVKKFDEAS